MSERLTWADVAQVFAEGEAEIERRHRGPISWASLVGRGDVMVAFGGQISEGQKVLGVEQAGVWLEVARAEPCISSPVFYPWSELSGVEVFPRPTAAADRPASLSLDQGQPRSCPLTAENEAALHPSDASPLPRILEPQACIVFHLSPSPDMPTSEHIARIFREELAGAWRSGPCPGQRPEADPPREGQAPCRADRASASPRRGDPRGPVLCLSRLTYVIPSIAVGLVALVALRRRR